MLFLTTLFVNFILRKNEREKEKKKEQTKRRRTRKEKRKTSTGEQKERKIICSTNMLAGFMLGLKSGCEFRRIFTIDQRVKREIFYTRANISRNENIGVKSMSKGIGMPS